MKINPLPFSGSDLRDLLSYDPLTGDLMFLPRKNPQFNSRSAGRQAARANASGYAEVKLFGKLYKAHRLIWLLMTDRDPFPLEVDHKDQNKLNNRWENLRLSDRPDNVQNTPSRNRLGFRGVFEKKKGKPYGAHIRIKGKLINLGSFDSAEEAHTAYRQVAFRHYGSSCCIDSVPSAADVKTLGRKV